MIPKRLSRTHKVCLNGIFRTLTDLSLGILEHFQLLDLGFDPSRVCIKIPSTWEGLEACRLLELSGIATLATTLFTIEQAWLAGNVGCEYIAPYVNELKVHFEEG
jgi:transaldolase